VMSARFLLELPSHWKIKIMVCGVIPKSLL